MTIETQTPLKNSVELIISRAQPYIEGKNFKEAVTSLASEINDDPILDEMQKKVLVGLAMDYKNKPDLSREDVDTFIDYIKRFFE